MNVMQWIGLIGVSFVLAACSGGNGANVPANTADNSKVEVQLPDNRPAPETNSPLEVVPNTNEDFVSFDSGLRVYPKKGVVELDAVVLGGQTRPLEFLVVSPGGATHEALFSAPSKGEHLKRALEMLSLKEAELKYRARGHREKPLGDRVQIDVRWLDVPSGKTYQTRVENWLLDMTNGQHPEEVGWVFTGSHESFDSETNRSRIEADFKGNLVGLWRDPSCVLDNDREHGYVNDCYSPDSNNDDIPDAGAPVTLIFKPHPEIDE